MIPADIVAPETVNVWTLEASGAVVLKAESVPDTVMVAVALTVLEAMALVCWVAPGLFKVMLPL